MYFPILCEQTLQFWQLYYLSW